MKEFVIVSGWAGKTIEKAYIGDDALWVSFSDGTYGRIEPERDYDDDAHLSECEGYVGSIYDARLMHTLGIMTDEELEEAEAEYSKKLVATQERQKKEDMATIARLLAKYPEMGGDR